MIVKAKKLHPGAIIPSKRRPGDAAFDLHAMSPVVLATGDVVTIDTGIALELPEGHFAMILGRSGLASKGIDVLAGCVDPNYRGPVGVVLANVGLFPCSVAAGDRIGQFVVLPVLPAAIEEVDELGETERGAAGFGSSGR